MREIEFRAWYNGRYHYNVGVLTSAVGGKPVCVIDGYDRISTFEPDSIEQYIGLKDKNGVKIFEGDILKSYHFTDPITGEDMYLYHDVQWSEKWLTWYAMNVRSTDRENYRGGCVDIRTYLRVNRAVGFNVIGNIHENPELLNP